MGIDDLPPSAPGSPVPENGFHRSVPLLRVATLSSGARAGPGTRAFRGANTGRLGLILPDLLDAALITDLNYNFGVLDDAILQGVAGTLVGYTLVDPILVRPQADDLALMQHTHQAALGGGALDGAAIATGTIGEGPLLRQTGASAATLNVAPPLNLDGTAGTPRGVVVRTGTPVGGYAPRWFVGADGTAEAGANAGSDLILGPADDAGAYQPAPALRLVRATGQAVFASTVRATISPATGDAFLDNDGHAWRSDGPAGNLLLDVPAGKAVGFSVAGSPVGVWAQTDGLYVNDAIARLRFNPARLGPKVVLYGADLVATHYGLGVEATTLALTVSAAGEGVGVGFRTPVTGIWNEAARINANGTVRGQGLAANVWLPGIAWEPGASPPTQRLETDGDARRWVWRFASGANNYMHCPTPIPTKHPGGTVRFTLYWRSVGGGTGFTWRAGASIRANGSAAPGNGAVADATGVASTGTNTTTVTTWTGTIPAADVLKEYIWYLQRLDANGQQADVEGLYIEFGV